MGERTDQIEQEIHQERGELGRNLQELERKVKSATDWREHFEKRPMAMIGIAFGSGFLLSALTASGSTGKRHRRDRSSDSWRRSDNRATEYQKQKAHGTWDNIKGALIGAGTAQVRGFLDEFVPGFREQYRRTEMESNNASLNPSSEQRRPAA
jgi:hypothetical protein